MPLEKITLRPDSVEQETVDKQNLEIINKTRKLISFSCVTSKTRQGFYRVWKKKLGQVFPITR